MTAFVLESVRLYISVMVHKSAVLSAAVISIAGPANKVVHHIDLDKHNHDPRNLAVLPNQSFHLKVHKGEVSDAELRRFSLIKEDYS